MKTRLPILFLFFFVFAGSYSQVPGGFNYQAIARDVSNNPITVPIGVRFTIRADSLTGTEFWVEEHNSVVPNENGVFNVVIGKGARISGLAKFSDIDWTVIPKYVMTEINYGGWKLLGSSKLWTVPYAMVADSLGGPVSKLKVKGSANSTADEALFEVKNKNGQTVFAVYSEGVRVYVGDGTLKSPKGGFAVSGFGAEKDENNKRYFFVDDDSVRVWVNDLGKSSKGGFAVSGFGYSKDISKKYLFASEDSVRIYIDDSAKGAKGGFAVSGFGFQKTFVPKYMSVNSDRTSIQVNDSLKGFSVTDLQGSSKSEFMNINKVNYSIGHESGLKTTPNVSIVKGKYNVFMGYKSGYDNTEGYGNVFMGHETGLKSTVGSYNVYMGFRAGTRNISGNSNVFLGYQSGENSTQSWNTYVGQGAGRWNSIGIQNTYIGGQAGLEDGYWYLNGYPAVPPGNNNTFIGYQAGYQTWSGDKNVIIGSFAGAIANYTSGNVLIGYRAGYGVSANNRLYINNEWTTGVPPLVYGEFSETVASRQFTVNSKTTVNGGLNYGAAGGTANAITVSIPGITAYTAGMVVIFKAAANNTAAACTINVNGLGAKSLFMKSDQNPSAGYIETNSIVMAVYDGTSFQMIQPAAN